MPITDGSGRLLGPFGLMLIAPEVGDAVQQLGAALRFRSGLSPRVRELAILTVAVAAGCEFEWWAHEQAALAAGLTVEQLQSILDGAVPDGLSDAEREAAGVSLALSRRRRLDDAEYAAAQRTLGTATLAELTWLVGYYGTLALALEVFAPASPAPHDDDG
ncbi:carboxymuconolactone decarboxylase family protein [Dactylosporangium sp. CA-092794]|uniref:carboxymuconolactone decarboxylase family protein n=1 Tax=Dactylosporangium sp. CA-092794 TaxID=3239929 RepID=UPI003D8A547D